MVVSIDHNLVAKAKGPLMNSIFNSNLFFIKEHRGLLKAANNYDIYDPTTEELVMECREPSLGGFTKFFRFTKYKTHTPFDIFIRSADQQLLLRMVRGVTWLQSEVHVTGTDNQLLATFKQKTFSIGGKFEIVDPSGSQICTLKGKWHSWDFHVEDNQGKLLAEVNKKWDGIGKELFTTADNYMLSIAPEVPLNDLIRPILVAAVMCIDMVLKER